MLSIGVNVADDFESLLGDDAQGIRRVKTERRVSLDKRPEKDVSTKQRQAAAQDRLESASDPLDTASMTMVAPMDLLSFLRPGVQHGVFKNLRLGRYSVEATLDMHRMSVEEARKALTSFVSDCLENDVRAALITHGKGEGRETPALLKSCVAHWLPQFDEVLAFHTAQKQHGSYGATYVLLRKSEAKKQKVREALARRAR